MMVTRLALTTRIASRAVTILTANAVRVGSALIVNQIILSKAGPQEYAFWALAQSLILFIGLIADCGFSFSHQSRFSPTTDTARSIVASTARQILQLRIVLSIVGAVVLMIALMANPLSHGRGAYVLVSGIAVFFWALIPSWYFSITKIALPYYLAESASFALYAASIFLASMIFESQLAFVAICIFVVVFGALSLFSVYMFAYRCGVVDIWRGRMSPVLHIAFRQLPALAVVLAPAFLGASVMYILSFKLEAAELATLLFCEKFMAAIAYGVGPIIAAMFPIFARMHARESNAVITRFFLTSAICLGGLVLFGVGIFVYGDEYIFEMLLPSDTAESVALTSMFMMWAVVPMSMSSAARSWLFSAARVTSPLMKLNWVFTLVVIAAVAIAPLESAVHGALYRVGYESAFLLSIWTLWWWIAARRKWGT